MKVGVVGTGYVGLVTGTCLAEMGNEVTCVDVIEEKVKSMRGGLIPIHEPGLEPIFLHNIQQQRLSFTTDLAEAVKEADVVFLALPTPPGEDGAADLSYILDVADKLGPRLKHYTVVVNKSTVPPGTAELVRKKIAAHAKVPFDVVSNPEFLKEGQAVQDFMYPDRVVVGSDSEKARAVMDELYEPFLQNGNPLEHVDTTSAELAKYAANAFLALKISYTNMMARVCEALGADIDSVRQIMGSDPRIASWGLHASIGWGGSCFPKDVRALEHIAIKQGVDPRMLRSIIDVNDDQKHLIPSKIKQHYGSLKGKKFALWGLAFKAHTDDIRESSALVILDSLTSAGAEVVAYDPEAMANVRARRPENKRLSLADNAYAALEGADALIIATEWPEFHTPDFDRIKQNLKKPVVFDGRNLFSLEKMKEDGFHYVSIGRNVVNG